MSRTFFLVKKFLEQNIKYKCISSTFGPENSYVGTKKTSLLLLENVCLVTNSFLNMLNYHWKSKIYSCFNLFFMKASSLSGQKDSIYSLAMNNAGTVLVSGSTEKVILRAQFVFVRKARRDSRERVFEQDLVKPEWQLMRMGLATLSSVGITPRLQSRQSLHTLVNSWHLWVGSNLEKNWWKIYCTPVMYQSIFTTLM